MTTKNEVAETVKKDKKYTIRIPEDQLNPKEKDVMVGINGKYAKIPRGQDVEVEESIYEVLKTAKLI